MNREKNMVGQLFGLWTVLERVPRSKREEPVYWLCRCVCGTVRPVNAKNLRNGGSQSCGCLHRPMSLTDTTFGRWTVVRSVGVVTPNGSTAYLCRCMCGNERIVEGCMLRNGSSTSCGCYQMDLHRKKPFEAIYNKLIKSAKDRGIKMDLSYEEYIMFSDTKACHYCEATIPWKAHTSYRGDNPVRRAKGQGTRPRKDYQGMNSYNIDRKNNKLGYSIDNCVVCCWLCNRTKNSAFTYEEFMLLAPTMKKIQELRKATL